MVAHAREAIDLGQGRDRRWSRWAQLVVPGDPEWPTHLDDLGDARPLVLWLRGTADLRLTCVNSVAVVGSRAATGYGNHVAIELATVPAEKASASSQAARAA